MTTHARLPFRGTDPVSSRPPPFYWRAWSLPSCSKPSEFIRPTISASISAPRGRCCSASTPIPHTSRGRRPVYLHSVRRLAVRSLRTDPRGIAGVAVDLRVARFTSLGHTPRAAARPRPGRPAEWSADHGHRHWQSRAGDRRRSCVGPPLLRTDEHSHDGGLPLRLARPPRPDPDTQNSSGGAHRTCRRRQVNSGDLRHLSAADATDTRRMRRGRHRRRRDPRSRYCVSRPVAHLLLRSALAPRRARRARWVAHDDLEPIHQGRIVAARPRCAGFAALGRGSRSSSAQAACGLPGWPGSAGATSPAPARPAWWPRWCPRSAGCTT